MLVSSSPHSGQYVRASRIIPTLFTGLLLTLGVVPAVKGDSIRESGLHGHAAAGPQQGTTTVTIHNMPAAVRDGRAQLIGHMESTQMLRLVIGIQPPHMEEEEAFLEQLQDKQSPQFHQFLTADQWNERFAPSAEDEQAVVDWTQSQGLTVTQRYANRLIVDLEAPAGVIESAFAVKLNMYRVGSYTYFSNDREATIPASLSGIVHAVAGMNNIQRLHGLGIGQADAGPGPIFNPGPVSQQSGLFQSDAESTAGTADVGPSNTVTLKQGYTPEEMWNSNAYDTQALYNQGHCCNPFHVAGGSPPESSIAIAASGIVSFSDLKGFHNSFPYLAYNVVTMDIDGTPSCPSINPSCFNEVTLDTEWSLAMSNSRGSLHDTAKVWVYQGGDTTTSTFIDVFNQILSDGHARVMSTSFGCAELNCWQQSDMETAHSTFNMMLGEGWSLVAAAGDNGATATVPNSNGVQQCQPFPSVIYPGSDPDLVSAGGTTLALFSNGLYVSEVAWTGGTSPGSCNTNNGGTGGGCSALWGRPGYQTNKDCPSPTGYYRSIPDLALNASIAQAYFFNGALHPIGGTSIVAPELAGFFAQQNAYLLTFGSICGPKGTGPCAPLGRPHYALYAVGNPDYPPHYPYYDITHGCNTNDVIKTAPPAHCARVGFDLVSGWGSFNMLQLAWDINYAVTADNGTAVVTLVGPATDHWYNKNETITFKVADEGGTFKHAGVAGFTQEWDHAPGDVKREATPGEGNTFYSGPEFPNATSGTFNLDTAGQGCHTAHVQAWTNLGVSSSDRTFGPVCYDTIAPVTTDSLTPAADSHGWNNTPVFVTLIAHDPGAPSTGSGVAHTYYAVDDPFCISIELNLCTVYSAPFEIKTEGMHNVSAFSEDVAGNFADDVVLPVNIDLTAPVTTDSLGGTLSGKDYISAVTVTLKATDNLSGVESTVYQLNGGAVQTYKGPFSVSHLGANTITFHSIDKAGNVESTKSVGFTIEDSTTTLLAASPNPSVTGTAVKFTATVKSSVGAATGTVTFKNGSTTLGTGTLSSGVATFSTSSLSIGMHSITAVYSGATDALASTSAALTQNVLATSSTALTESLSTSVYGQSVTFTTVTTSPTTGTITGTVNFYDGALLIGTGTISGDKASVTTTTLAVGAHSIVATYLGSTSYATSTSNTVAHTVNVAATGTTLTSSPNPSVFGQSVTYTATVTAVAPGGGTPTGLVTFLNGTTTIGTGTLSGGKAIITNNTLPIGTSSITAKYDGSASYTASTSSALTQKVNPTATATDLTSSPNPSTAGATVTFRAFVSSVAPGAGTPTGSVTFMNGVTILGTVSLGPGGIATFNSAFAKGTYSITGVYSGSADHLPSTSAVLVQTVN